MTNPSDRPKCVMIIPARGGSKGLPRKNVLPFRGKPLISWSIHAGLDAAAVDDVYVSTDDDEIAVAAEAAGAKVIRRPDELASDTASSEAALLHALDKIEEADGPVDILVFAQCTSPLMTASDVDGVVQALLDNGADTSFAGAPFHRFVWRLENDEVTAVNHPQGRRDRRQDRPKELLEAGSIYAMRAPGFRQSRYRFFGKIAAYSIAPERAVEIDDLADFEFAEALAANMPWEAKSPA